jgi:predicted helicase
MGKVFYADLWGLQGGKYRYLWENDISTTEWQELEPVAPHFFFVPKEFDLLSEYERGWSVADIFPVNSTGIKTHRDHFVIDFDEERLRSRIAEFRDETLSDDEVGDRFKLGDTGSWKLSEARAKLQARKDWDKNFDRCLYRPFDIRPIYYSGDVIDRPRSEVMHHMLRENIALLTMRRIRTGEYAHFLVTKWIVGKDVVSLRDSCNIFPLYLYTIPEEKPKKGGGSVIALTLFEPKAEYETRDPNLSPKFIAAVEEKLGLEFVREGKGDLEATFGPEDILHYAYAVFHSPTYRERYAEFLKIDFPRLPLTSDRELFKALAEKGEELVSLHLMETPKLNGLITHFPVPGSDRVEKARYVEKVTEEKKVPADASPSSVKVFNRRLPLVFEHQTRVKIKPKPKPRPTGRVYINKTQYFEGIEPEVWEFQVGGYQVLDKWLKDRKGRKLTFDDLFHWQKIVVALKQTMRLMGEIDELIPAWPIE